MKKKNQNGWEEKTLEKILICQLCSREIPEDYYKSKHHLIPVLKGGKNGEQVFLHQVCHTKIHSIFSESELAKEYFTIEKIKENPQIQKFVVWISKKHPQFNDTNKRWSLHKKA